MWKENPLKRIDSTQKAAIRKIKDGKIKTPESFFSFNQFNGYGTHGKKWEHCKDSLAISFAWPSLLTPKLNKVTLPMITSTLVVKGLESYVKFPKYSLGLKWPNDLMKAQKKIGGVLVQTVNHNCKQWIIVGIGVNLLWETKPTNLYFGSLLEKKNKSISKAELVFTVSQSMEAVIKVKDMSKVLDEFNKRDIFSGKSVKISNKKLEYIGKNYGVCKNGGICIRDKNGNIQIFQTGSLSSV